MNRRIFDQLIAESRFRELFIREMGWNNPTGRNSFAFTIGEHSFRFRPVAERSGFQVIECETVALPTAQECRQLDSKLRPTHSDYICIYHMPASQHHLWTVPVRKVEKRSVVAVEYDTAASAGFLFEKIADISFDIEELTTITDVVKRVQSAFIVNSEKITKDFYRDFRKEHKAFAEFITGIDDHIATDRNRSKQWFTSVMLNRLMFCYFVQKKGFLDGDTDYLQHKLAWVKREQGENRFFSSFYKGFLAHLFHQGLNAPRHSDEFRLHYGQIPYLNGGMFDVHRLERDYADLDIADEAFERLFAFFDQWRWHLDTRITANGKDINPDVLGYIFEQYINDRAAMGAYYTKEDITEYISKNCILPFLMDRLKEADPRAFAASGEVWTMLRRSSDRYIYDAVKHGYTPNWQQLIPADIARGIDTAQPYLLERRAHWNTPTPGPWALPTEIWRETIERLQRCQSLLESIASGSITEINDFITLNLDIRSFVFDLLATTPDRSLVKHFYHALQQVTILDPTCGSGAFLFAAMNILEPLYEVCIERMQQWNHENPLLFKSELAEIDNKYRSNIQYFIYKSIILRNLYGVDIMVEATEIAKLRLFLKMVAVVEVDRRADNMGLDPLPDIDFNIRAGNTLVGYATEQQLLKSIVGGDMFARQEFENRISNELDLVSQAYSRFREIQISQRENVDGIHEAKKELRERLSALNEILNQNLYTSTSRGRSYAEWLATHQPFHWLAEFYQIMHDNGGFDVIIGNPPYVVYTRKNKTTKLAISDIYKLNDYETLPTANLYSFVIERCTYLRNKKSTIGMIVPISAFSSERMLELQRLFKRDFKTLYVSTFHQRPAQLFEGVLQRLSIFIAISNKRYGVFTTGITRWYAVFRHLLFQTVRYVQSDQSHQQHFIKVGSDIESKIFAKYSTNNRIINNLARQANNNNVYYRSAGGGYWATFLNENFENNSSSSRVESFISHFDARYYTAALNSNLFWWYYSINFDLFNFTDYMVFGFQLDFNRTIERNIVKLSTKLECSLRNNAHYYTINSKTNGATPTVTYQKQLSKGIIDEIDKVLAKHYGFTEEELDFIINYDIKYRMGDELNGE